MIVPLPIPPVVTSSPTAFCIWSFSCWSWHSDNEISFDGKKTDFSFHFKYCSYAISQFNLMQKWQYIQLCNCYWWNNCWRLSNNHQLPQFTPHQYFILYGICKNINITDPLGICSITKGNTYTCKYEFYILIVCS